MNSIDLILLNFSEIRRRSLKLWKGIPVEFYHWKPDIDAFSIIEMIRHVLEGEYSGLADELNFSQEYRTQFIGMIRNLEESDLEIIKIERTEVGQVKLLGDYLNRISYHESVHTGQLLNYLGTLSIARLQIWD